MAGPIRKPHVKSQGTEPAPAVLSSFQHPYRALPPGHQWVGHCGRKAKARYLRQQAAKLRKQMKSRAVSGVDPDSGGLILDFDHRK
jgi:hypothetical protein